MKTFASLVFSTFVLFATFLPGTALAASVSITSVSATTVTAKQLVTFTISPTGFESPSYRVSDSFPNSTVTPSTVNAGGNFSWIPVAKDAGSHILTVSASDSNGNEASSQITITVLPLPTASIQRTPTGDVAVNTRVSFSVSQTGFTNPTFSLSDAFSGSTIGNVTPDASGGFSWTPDLSQQGNHTISVYVSDAAGHSATANVDVYVGSRPSLSMFNLFSGNSLPIGNAVPVGTTTTFSVAATAFIPSAFSVSDNFPNTSLSPNAVSNTGLFSWVPLGQDIGTHVLTITGSVGPFGTSATTSQTLIVYDPAKPGAAGAAAPAPKITVPTTQSPVPQSALAAVSGGYRFTTVLTLGSQGNEVSVLQALLSGLGFFTAKPTGYFGPATAEAVKKFQAAHGISQLGILGPQTRTALNALSGAASAAPASTAIPAPATSASPTSAGGTYVFEHFMGYGQNPDDGPDVMELQKRLSSLGYFSGTSTGYFGNVTVAAVKKFQAANGIEATGYVGKETRAALNR